jgi:hypothetical protein
LIFVILLDNCPTQLCDPGLKGSMYNNRGCFRIRFEILKSCTSDLRRNIRVRADSTFQIYLKLLMMYGQEL